MRSVICVDIPIQMISCTDTDGKITPLRFRFRDESGEIITITIDRILSNDQNNNIVGANYTCQATLYGTTRRFNLRYNYHSHEWRLYQLQV